MLQTGETLAGYRIEAVAGVGGMGIVYRATQLSLERRVALKVLSTTLVGNQRFRERFRQEGRHAAALDHPNIIPVYEAGESNGLMFIAMRFVDGPTLADMIMQQSLTGGEALRVLGAIASALDAAHDAGLIHRDVKPHNILLTGGGHPYLADFGITKAAQGSSLTHSGDFVGSISYVAPEQIDGRDVTRASDIYSLTAVLFHCLTGSLPYDHDTEAALMHAHLFAPPPTISALGVDAPRALDEVIARGMAKAPADRFGTAGDLLDACREALAGRALERCPALAPGPAYEAPREPDAGRGWRTPAPAPPAAAPAAVLDPALAPARGATAADRRVAPATAPAPAPAARRRRPPAPAWEQLRRPALVVAAAVALVGAPLLGYVLGHTDKPAAPATARSASAQITYAPPWKPAGATIAGLGVDGAAGLRRADGSALVAGRLRDPAPGFDPAPAALRERAARSLKPVTVRLGARTAVRYAAPLRDGGWLWLATFPDTRGWTTVACSSPARPPDRTCAAVAATLRPASGAPVTMGPDKAVAAALDRAFGTLNTARARARPGLRSRALAIRAGSFRALASADRAAARALTGLKLRPQEPALFAAIADALRAEAGALDRLARAARGRRRAAFDRRREALGKAERRVGRAVAQLRAAGYRARR